MRSLYHSSLSIYQKYLCGINLCVRLSYELMDKFYSQSNNKISVIPLLVILFVTVVGISSSTSYTHEKSFSLMVFAQEFPNLVTNSSNISISPAEVNSNNSTKQSESKTVVASGHFANNQMEDGTVTWIQGGLWNLEIDNTINKNIENSNMSATFEANSRISCKEIIF